MVSRRTRDDVGERETRHHQRKTVTTQARLRTDFERVEDRIRQATRRLGRVAAAPPVPPARPPPAPRQTGRDRSPPRPPPGDVDLLVGEQRVQLQVRRPARDSRWPSLDLTRRRRARGAEILVRVASTPSSGHADAVHRCLDGVRGGAAASPRVAARRHGRGGFGRAAGAARTRRPRGGRRQVRADRGENST